MPPPTLTREQVAQLVPQAKAIGNPCKGGQKQVFPCEIDGTRYALKFLATDPIDVGESEGMSVEPFDEVLARARREIAIMAQCTSPHLVKLGPISLTKAKVEGQTLVYFTE